MYDSLIEEARNVDPESEEASEIVDDLINALNEYAPEYCYFGTSEGDGACFGYWPSLDAIQEAIRYGFRLLDGRVVTEDGRVIEVDDHGNVTIWELETGREILGVA
jgi:hypothetical protein